VSTHSSPRMKRLFDPFAGICTVSRHFKKLGYRITTGDVLYQSYVFQMAAVKANRQPFFSRLLRSLNLERNDIAPHELVLGHLNQLPGRVDFVSRNYSLASPNKRRFFTRPNARKIDAIRTTIAAWRSRGLISPQEEAYLLASLLNALDCVANTAGTYYAFLKRFYRKAKRGLFLRPLEITSNGQRNRIWLCEATDLVQRTSTDILYLDPPYNERDYRSYYHLTESIATWDKPRVMGRAGLPVRPRKKSEFCSRTTAEKALARLISCANAKLILLHYSTKGLVSHEKIVGLLRQRGSTTFHTWRVRRYATSKGGAGACNHRLYVCRPHS
jgi:adenine-specific DNA-methyltransferase